MIGAVIKIILLIVCALMLVTILKSVKSGVSVFVLIFVTAAVFVFVCTQLGSVIDFIDTLASKAGIDEQYIGIILKCIGVCFLGDFAAGICRDCGESTLANNSEIVCKCSIIVIALPMYIDIFNLILKLWENV